MENKKRMIVGYESEMQKAAENSAQNPHRDLQKTAEVGMEDKSLRTASARHYFGNGGERKAVISGGVRHYFSKADNRMRRIDNTLEYKERGANGFDGYENKYNSFKVRFAKETADGRLMRVTKDGCEIMFSLAQTDVAHGMSRLSRRACSAILQPNKNSAPDNDGLESGIAYPNLMDGVHFGYEVAPDKIKENITLERRLDCYEFTFEVTAAGLRIETDEEKNTVNFYSDLSPCVPVFTMPAPYMYDKNGAESYAVKYRAMRQDDKYMLAVIPDADWINAAERAFPVVIDPTVLVNTEVDLFYKLVSNYSDYSSKSDFYRVENACKQLGYFRGNASPSDAAKLFGETYLYVGLNNSAQIRKGKVHGAILRIPIYLSPFKMNSMGYFAVYGVRENGWMNGALDWDSQPTCDDKIIANTRPKTAENGGYYLEFDVTAAICEEYTGFVVKGNSIADSYGAGQQNSVCIPENGNQKVELAVTYSEANYVRGGKTISQACHRAGSGAIDLFTGGLVFAHDVLKLEGAQFPMDISLVYNSDYFNRPFYGGYGCGRGWHLNFMQRLESRSALTGDFAGGTDFKCYEYTDAFGCKQEISTRYYREVDSEDGQKKIKLYGAYEKDSPLNKEISNDNFTCRESGGAVLLCDKSGGIMRFENNRLTAVEKEDSSGSVKTLMSIYYGTDYITVTDANGRVVRFDFLVNSQVNLLKEIIYNGEVIRSFNYDVISANRPLKTISAPYGNINFDYDVTYGYLKKITDPSGYTLEYKTAFEDRPKITGYCVKSSVAEISYNPDENAGLVTGEEKISEDVNITYNAARAIGNFEYVFKNLTAVENAEGAGVYCCFKSDGSLIGTFDDKGNAEMNCVRVHREEKTVGGCKVNSDTVTQISASVLAGADCIQSGDMYNTTEFLSQSFFAPQSAILDNNLRLPTGWYVCTAAIEGCIASGKNFDDMKKAQEEEVSYVAMRFSRKMNDGTSQEELAVFDSIVSDYANCQMAFLPFYYDAENIDTARLSLESYNNPHFVHTLRWELRPAAKCTRTTVENRDVVTSEKYENKVRTVTESDIEKRNDNTRKTTVTRGENALTAVKTYSANYTDRLIKQTNGLGLETSYAYGANGMLSSETAVEIRTKDRMIRSYSYQSSETLLNDNALTSVTDESGNRYAYDYYPETGCLKRMTLPGTRQSIDYTYNGMEGLLKKISTSQGMLQWGDSNEFSYNQGYLTRLKSNGCLYGFEYDGFGRITQISVGGKEYLRAGYESGGNDIDGVIGATSKTAVAYKDGINSPCARCGNTVCGETHAQSGKTINKDTVYASYYNKYGELLKVRLAWGVELSYAFTEADDYVTAEEITAADKHVYKYTVGERVYEYEYDKNTGAFKSSTEYIADTQKLKLEALQRDDCGRVSQVKYTTDTCGEQTYGYRYRFDDTVADVTLPNGMKSETMRNAFGCITSHTTLAQTYYYKRRADGSLTPLVDFTDLYEGSDPVRYAYGYDENGNITRIEKNETCQAAYEYDGLGRLTKEEAEGDKREYVYDASGNMRQKTIGGKIKQYAYINESDILLSYNGSEALTYDAYGNPKQWFKHEKEGSKLKYTLRFEKVNRLSKITDNDSGEEYEYEYNYNGIRTTKRVNGITHEYYLDGENIIAETRTSGDKTDKLKYYYDALGICGMEYNGDYYYYVKNIQGDITHVCKQEDSGISEVYAQYEYDAWGVRKVKKDVGE